jgi:hypothetical protein
MARPKKYKTEEERILANKERCKNYYLKHKEEILDKIDVEEMMQRGVGFNPVDPRKFVKVQLDNYFPNTIRNNINNFENLIASDATNTISNLLPK